MDIFPKDTSHFKLIVSDFDGTIVGNDRIISSKTISSIKKWIASGREFCIATGRQYLMIKDECKTLGLVNPVVVRGGAEIVDPLSGKVIYSQMIEKNIMKELVSLLQEKGFEISIEKDDKIYSDYYFRPEFPQITFKRLVDFPYVDAPKVVTFAIGEDMYEKEEFIKEVLAKRFPQLHIVEIYAREGKGWDITSLRATKNLAVLELLKLLDIKREDAVGVGDGYNDFPLLEAVGLKVAMGNGREELKAIADFVVPDYDEDGVAYLIEKLL